MGKVISSNVALTDTIFVHLAGESTAIELLKSSRLVLLSGWLSFGSSACSFIGVTIADNGTGKAFVKKVAEGSVAEKSGVLPGDHISAVDGKSVVGLRHFQVALILRNVGYILCEFS